MPFNGSLLSFRNKLTFPAGVAPGFDPNHVASIPGNVGIFSFVPTINLIKPKQPTFSGTSPLQILGSIGPTLSLPNSSAPLTFSGYPAVTPTSITHACIVMPSSTSVGGARAIGSTGATNGTQIYLNAGVLHSNDWTDGNVSSGITLSAGVPYFVAWSQDGTLNSNFVVMNLITGQMQSVTIAGIVTLNATDGSPLVGSFPAGNAGFAGNVAAYMFSGATLSLATLERWSSDPFAFWYPRNRIEWVGKIAAAPIAFVRRNIIRASAKGFR